MCWLCCLSLFLITSPLQAAKQPKYKVSDIPLSLLSGVYAVVRVEDHSLQVKDKSLAIHKVKKAITVLDKSGQQWGQLSLFYSKFTDVEELNATIYNSSGEVIKKVGYYGFKDYSAISESTLYSDHRVKAYSHETGNYPYTIEYEYTLKYRGTMFLPGWRPVPAPKVSLVQSTFEVRFPKQNPILYHEANLPTPVQKSLVKDQEVYSWKAQNLRWQASEPMGPAASSLNPRLMIALSEYQMDDYIGSNQSWEDIANWYYRLNEGRDELPETAKLTVQKLLVGATSPRERVARIYQYLQQNTRYVSIQLGIGGWQSFEASLVDEKGYGDCKALTNYTKAMLKVAGINAHEAIIYGGRSPRPVVRDFPSSQFNHVILCVPLAADTIWLECTSQTTPMGYLGSFTGDRLALLVKETGGELIRTPALSQAQNLQQRIATLTIDEQGHAAAQITTTYQGLQYENNSLPRYLHEPAQAQKEWLYEKLDIPSFEIMDFSLSKQATEVPQAKEQLQLHINNYASVSGKRLFFKANILNRWQGIPPSIEARQQDMQRIMAFSDQDSIHINLPAGYHAEYLPEPIEISNEFGQYSASYEPKEGGLIYVRRLQLSRGHYPAEAYERYRKFIKQVVKADKTKVVVLKST